MPSRVDLHTHTTASDGTLAPAQLLRQASELGIQILAVTDHDSTAGYTAMRELTGQYPSVRLIPAIEINAEGEFACHLLGYFIDPDHAPLQARLEELRRLRQGRIQAMVKKINELGMDIQYERVLALSKGGSVGRPHLADALVEKGYVASRRQAFERFLKMDGPAYVRSAGPSIEESIALIRGAGGIPVLAHPAYYNSEALLKRLVELGIRGLEVYYPEHSRSLTRRYLEWTQTYHLVATGGSDFHGPRSGRSALGCVDVPESVVHALEQAAGER